jgi:hypothetical protein
MNTEEAGFSKVLVAAYQTAGCHNPEAHTKDINSIHRR